MNKNTLFLLLISIFPLNLFGITSFPEIKIVKFDKAYKQVIALNSIEGAVEIWSSKNYRYEWTYNQNNNCYELQCCINFINDEHIQKFLTQKNDDAGAYPGYGKHGFYPGCGIYAQTPKEDIVTLSKFTLECNPNHSYNFCICTYESNNNTPINRLYLNKQVPSHICFVLNKFNELCFCLYGEKKTDIERLRSSELCKFRYIEQ